MKVVANLFALSIILGTFSFGEKITCPFGTSVTSSHESVECEEPRSCNGCDPLILNLPKTLKCSKPQSCFDITADIIAAEDFSLKCEDDISCARNRADCSSIITINCDGKSIDGIKCSGRRSCQYTRFIIDGGREGCNVKKIECQDRHSCYAASFEFIGHVYVEEFICDEDSCNNIFCTGSIECPLSIPAPLCTELPTTPSPITPVDTTQSYVVEESSLLAVGRFAAGFVDDMKDGKELNADTVKTEYISINLSSTTIGILWAMMVVCLVVNIVLFLGPRCKRKREQTFGDADSV